MGDKNQQWYASNTRVNDGTPGALGFEPQPDSLGVDTHGTAGLIPFDTHLSRWISSHEDWWAIFGGCSMTIMAYLHFFDLFLGRWADITIGYWLLDSQPDFLYYLILLCGTAMMHSTIVRTPFWHAHFQDAVFLRCLKSLPGLSQLDTLPWITAGLSTNFGVCTLYVRTIYSGVCCFFYLSYYYNYCKYILSIRTFVTHDEWTMKH